jgi:hypothetical protein
MATFSLDCPANSKENYSMPLEQNTCRLKGQFASAPVPLENSYLSEADDLRRLAQLEKLAGNRDDLPALFGR